MQVDGSREMVSSLTTEQLSDFADRTDRDLLARIADRDKCALQEFFLRHAMQVHKLLYPLSDMRSVEEVLLDSFVVVWREAHKFRGESRALIWLLKIVYGQALAAHRSELARSNGTAASDFGEDASGNTARPQWLSRATVPLPFAQRAALELGYGLRLSCDEMASVMQCSPKIVKTTLLHARRALDLASAKMPRK
jgi:RNA polymerase sigma-70 factor (ECF subfamily)